jgi:mRNA-degrading endonuclease YafQ of YafQ-DinJ toxin-antitoxin module
MVNTFLPTADFKESAKMLDRQRLGKQRVEVIQLLKANLGMTKGWRNHPAAVMWRGYELALANYGIAICGEWMKRGYRDTCALQIVTLHSAGMVAGSTTEFPPWLGDEDFHRSHQSNLLRKAPEFYSQYNWDVSDDLPYVWPKP